MVETNNLSTSEKKKGHKQEDFYRNQKDVGMKKSTTGPQCINQQGKW